MTDQHQSDNTTKFSITYSLDNGHFFRRECPSCGREFKTQADEADLVTAMRPAFREVGIEIGADPDEEGQSATLDSLHCPYCAHTAPTSDMLTARFSQYLERFIMREHVLPQIDRTLAGFSDEFNRKSRQHSGGLISISIEAEYSRSLLPPRPISGPEPSDMMPVHMLCCDRRIKVLDGWCDLLTCPFCGRQTELH